MLKLKSTFQFRILMFAEFFALAIAVDGHGEGRGAFDECLVGDLGLLSYIVSLDDPNDDVIIKAF